MRLRKLNNKGFTLIELLAVIVILAVVMGIAANSVINSMNNSRKGALKDNVLVVQDAFNTAYVESQVESATTIYTMNRAGLIDGTPTKLTDDAIEALKMDPNDIDTENSWIRFDTGRETFEVCLAASSTGKFYVANAKGSGTTLIGTGGGTSGAAIASGVMYWCTPKFATENGAVSSSY